MSWETMRAKAIQQVADCIVLAQNVVLKSYGATYYEFKDGFPASVEALYAAHESAGVRWVRTNYPEYGLHQLTGKVGDNEISTLNVQPFDARSNIWASQQAFWKMQPLVAKALADNGYLIWECQPVAEQITLMLLPRAVGIGCTRGLLKQGALFRCAPTVAMQLYLESPTADTTPFDGAQTTDVVRLRFSWCQLMVQRSQAVGIGPLPGALVKPSAARPAGLVTLPRYFVRDNDYYYAKAKAEGPKPTGPWPTGAKQ
jgi:hypothetical protein